MLDPESGLYYYGGRYYDPELGRFISPDPFIGQPDDPQNHNRYSYVVNNPVNNIDPDGYFHQVKKKKKKGGFFRSFFGRLLVSIVAGVITGGIAGVVAEAAGFAASTVSTIANTAAGIAAGATMAGLSGGNPLLGGLIGGTFGFLTGGGLTGVQPGADFPVSPALSDTAGSGALFANFLPRGGSSGNIVLASGPHSTGEFFRTGSEETIPCAMNPNVRCAPGPGPETQQSPNPETNPLNMDKAKEFLRDLGRAGEELSRGQVCSEVTTGGCGAAAIGVFKATKNPRAALGFFGLCIITGEGLCTAAPQPPSR